MQAMHKMRVVSIRLMVLVLSLVLMLTACKSKAERVQQQLDLGQKYLTDLNYTEAILAFTKAIEIDPESIPAYMGRAEAYRGTEQYEEAKTDYTTVIDKTEEQPYAQAEAYVGRAEVDELTADERGALSDYQSAANVLEKVDIEKITDVTEQMLEALKVKVYNACARLSAFFNQHEAAVASYTSALESLARLPDDAEVMDVPAEKVVSYTGRAASNLKLEAYEEVLPDYDALISLGENKIQERDTLLEVLSLSHSQISDLGETSQWLEEVNHSDYAHNVQMDIMLGTLEQAAALAQENGAEAYDDVRELLTSEENEYAMQNLLARNYQLRYYDVKNDRMLAVYANETAWEDVDDEASGTITPEMLETPVELLDEDELNAVDISPMYVYYGEYEGRSREGEGLWYILNPSSRDYEARTYQWENDEPVGGFAQRAATQTATSSTAVQPAAQSPQWMTFQSTSSNIDGFPGYTRTTTVTYQLYGTSFQFHEVWTDPNGATSGTTDQAFVLSQPIQAFQDLGSGGVFSVPTGTVVTTQRGFQSTVTAGRNPYHPAGGIGSYTIYFNGI